MSKGDKNDITGDSIRTKGTLSKEGRDNWEKIFGKKEKNQAELEQEESDGLFLQRGGSDESGKIN